jgi:hypothetical protein
MDHKLGERTIKHAIAKSQVLCRTLADINARISDANGLDKRFRRIDCGNQAGPDPIDQLARQRSSPAAYVEYSVAGANTGEIGHLYRKQSRVPAHEAVVRRRRHIKSHCSVTLPPGKQ